MKIIVSFLNVLYENILATVLAKNLKNKINKTISYEY